MAEAGLGSYTLHSTRGSSATCALLMGMDLHEIVSNVGWTSENTFIHKYLKPLRQVGKYKVVDHNKSHKTVVPDKAWHLITLAISANKVSSSLLEFLFLTKLASLLRTSLPNLLRTMKNYINMCGKGHETEYRQFYDENR